MTDAALAAHLQQLEEELLRPDVRRNRARLTELLADDFREFGASGRIFDKASILTELSTESPAQLSLSDFACHKLAADIALVTYRSRRIDTAGTRDALRSSLWIHRDGRWQILFHQGARA
ncbi:MAG TPA: DUF4440 domain-containing protein [Candidatus Aquilonibacter sp.]|nr:DUF4440 domain-containing protein [Candidatus Aquilonibacter sp.]